MGKDLKGVFVPIITPLRDDYDPDRDALNALINFLSDSGVHALVPLGSTGEFARFSEEQRKTIAEWTMDAVHGRLPIIVGAASASTDLSVRLAKHAEDIGAQGLQVSAPFYGKPTDEELYQHFRAVADSVDIPLFVYNNPWTTGVDILPTMMRRLSEIPNIRYAKEASGDARRVSQIIRLTEGRMTVFAGSDDTMFEAFLTGATGWVSGLANFAPRESVQLYSLCVDKGDFSGAMELYHKLIPLGELLETSGKFVQYIKAGIEFNGMRAGPPRRPQLPITEEERINLAKMMNRLRGETDLRSR